RARGVSGTDLVAGGRVSALPGVVEPGLVARAHRRSGLTLPLGRVAPERRAVVRHDARPPPRVFSPPATWSAGSTSAAPPTAPVRLPEQRVRRGTWYGTHRTRPDPDATDPATENIAT